ncbi:MAG: YraN family protein [Candidatus Atribacteria bacterium]|nr:YraN family protein [Candidatus Atribacteria bacterium]
MKSIGDSGEELARAYLFKKGYRILEQNYKVSFGEIDIIAEKSNCICFVEVKSRKSNKYGTPEEAITRYKQKKIVKVAQLYIKQKRIKDKYFRFDVIVVVFNNYLLKEIKHITNVFFE